MIDVTGFNLLDAPGFASPFSPSPFTFVAPSAFIAPPPSAGAPPSDDTTVDDNDLIAQANQSTESAGAGGGVTVPSGAITLGALTVLGTVNTTSGGPIETSLGLVQETGFITATLTFSTAGTYVIGIGVVNEGDTAVESALLVDDVRVNGSVLDGFENGFENWAISGDASTVAASFGSGPTEGALQALLQGRIGKRPRELPRPRPGHARRNREWHADRWHGNSDRHYRQRR